MNPEKQKQAGEIISEILKIAPFLKVENRSDLSEFFSHFYENLTEYAEISFSPYDPVIGVMTRCVQVDQITGYLKDRIPEKTLAVALDAAGRFPGAPVMIKQDFGEAEVFDFTLYWQVLVPLNLTLNLARRHNFYKEENEIFKELMLLLRSDKVYTGLSLTSEGVSGFRVFFSNPLKQSASYFAPAFSSVMTRLGLDARAINYFIGLHNFLAPAAHGQLFTSIALDGKRPAGVKLDYEIIPPAYAVETMNALEIPASQIERFINILNVLQMKNVTYLSLKFAPGKLPTLKIYLDRRFSTKNSENPEVLANFLRNTTWT